MKTSYSKKQITLSVACALALGLAASAVQAQALAPANDRELWGAAGSQTWKNGFGECWHGAFGPAAPYGECNPAPKAEYVAPKAAPIVVAAATPQPVYEKVTLDANVLFDFNKSELRPAGRDSLDSFIAKTRDLVNPGSMLAVGYADRIGTGSYNQNLSEARVASVKSYLVSKGIPSDQIGTSGKGERQPTTRGECDGATNAKSIACLHPDRHVSIELTGSRLVK